MAKHHQHTSYSGSGIEFRLNNPIPGLLSAKDNAVVTTAEKHPIVPYAGGEKFTGWNVLNIIESLYHLSPSQRAVIDKIQTLAFGGDLDIMERSRKGLVAQRGEVPLFEKNALIDHLEKVGIELLDISAITRAVHRSESVFGTGFVRVRIANVDGIYKATIVNEDLKYVFRLRDKNPAADINNMVIVLKSADAFAENKKDEIQYVGLYPKFTVRNGVIETVFQKNQFGAENLEYGRPKASLNDLYADYQRTNRTAKISATEMIALYLLFAQKSASEYHTGIDGEEVMSETQQFAEALRDAVSNMGNNSKSIAAMSYPNGCEAPIKMDFDVNRDFQYFKWEETSVKNAIASSYGLDPIIAGFDAAPSGIGASILPSLIIRTQSELIQPIQDAYSGLWDNILEFILSNTGGESLLKYSIKFPSKIEKMLADIKAFNSNNTQQAPAPANQ